MNITGGQGVDIVLNSLTGDFIPEGLSVLGPNGRFIEIGTRDVWDADRVARFKSGIVYRAINLFEYCRNDPESAGSRLGRLVEAFDNGRLKTLPLKVFPLKNVARAFRYMAQARHIGKIVISHPAPANGRTSRTMQAGRGEALRFSGDGSYLITGGLGGLGLELAKWLIERGARHLVLMGRSAPTAEAARKIGAYHKAGVHVEVVQADVAAAESLRGVLEGISASSTSLRGIFHCAGVVDDGVLVKQSWDRFARVMSPKVTGTWNLHTLTRGHELDFFVIFSSVVSVLGSAGQANHSSACAFEDGISHYRRAHGLPSLSINWGPWSTVGAVVKHHVGNRLRARGIFAFSPSEALNAMETLMLGDRAQAVVLRADWPKIMNRHQAGRTSSFLSEIAAGTLRDVRASACRDIGALVPAISRAAPDEGRKLLHAHVREVIIQILDMEPSCFIDPQQGLRDLGIDSLMSLELRNRLQTDIGQPLPSTLVFDFPTVGALVDFLAGKVIKAEPPAETIVPKVCVGREANRAQLDQLTEEEAEALLIEELSKCDSREQ
jgi:NAD(P)-dependent dehydrogenase (short-subunit alcohol dehydrogenase family)/acyl carrier protein